MSSTKAESVATIERGLGVLLRRVRRTSGERARLLHPDLQPAAYDVFCLVRDNEPTRACDIVEQLGMDKGAVSRAVGSLFDLGLIERNCDPGDHRVQNLVLTADAKERVAALAQQRRAETERRLVDWSPEHLEEFAERLDRYNESLKIKP